MSSQTVRTLLKLLAVLLISGSMFLVPFDALAYATGLVDSKGMAISGTILCLVGLALTFVMMYCLGAIGFFG